MACESLHDIVNRNDTEAFERYLQDNHSQPIDYCLEDIIISEHKEQLLSLLIKYDCISDDAMSLSGTFDDTNKLKIKLKSL